MIRILIVASLVLGGSLARAEDTADDHIARARDFHAKGDFVHARDELRTAYQLDARPELLFALGQVEFNIGDYSAAIDYYERFSATNPSAEQAALAQQAIGAARIKLSQPPPPPQPPKQPPPHRHFDVEDAGLSALGGLAIVLGAGLLWDSHHLAEDRSGSLRAYDDRIGEAHTTRYAGITCASLGAVAIAAALVRWRLRLEDSVIEIHGSATGVGVTWEHAL